MVIHDYGHAWHEYTPLRPPRFSAVFAPEHVFTAEVNWLVTVVNALTESYMGKSPIPTCKA